MIYRPFLMRYKANMGSDMASRKNQHFPTPASLNVLPMLFFFFSSSATTSFLDSSAAYSSHVESICCIDTGSLCNHEVRVTSEEMKKGKPLASKVMQSIKAILFIENPLRPLRIRFICKKFKLNKKSFKNSS